MHKNVRMRKTMHTERFSLLCVLLVCENVVVVSAIAVCRIIDAMLCISVTQPHTLTNSHHAHEYGQRPTGLHTFIAQSQTIPAAYPLQTRSKLFIRLCSSRPSVADRRRKYALIVQTKKLRDTNETNNQRTKRPKTTHAYTEKPLSVLRQRMLMMMPPHQERKCTNTFAVNF